MWHLVPLDRNNIAISRASTCWRLTLCSEESTGPTRVESVNLLIFLPIIGGPKPHTLAWCQTLTERLTWRQIQIRSFPDCSFRYSLFLTLSWTFIIGKLISTMYLLRTLTHCYLPSKCVQNSQISKLRAFPQTSFLFRKKSDFIEKLYQ